MRSKKNLFPKKFRINEPKIFRRLFSSPQKKTTPYFVLRFMENAESHARLGIILGKNKMPRAVDRHRVQRMVRETFRMRRRDLPNLDLLIYFHRGVPQQELEAMRAQLGRVLGRLGATRPPPADRGQEFF